MVEIIHENFEYLCYINWKNIKWLNLHIIFSQLKGWGHKGVKRTTSWVYTRLEISELNLPEKASIYIRPAETSAIFPSQYANLIVFFLRLSASRVWLSLLSNVRPASSSSPSPNPVKNTRWRTKEITFLNIHSLFLEASWSQWSVDDGVVVKWDDKKKLNTVHLGLLLRWALKGKVIKGKFGVWGRERYSRYVYNKGN